MFGPGRTAATGAAAVRVRVALAAAISLVTLGACALLAAGDGVDLAPAASAPAARGELTLLCGFSHAAPDDPIVAPGRAGASHQHQFFGNRRVDAGTTGRTITRGPTTCGESGDRSGYWVPALLVDGREVTPRGMRVTYERPARSPRVRPVPAGLRVVVGDARATTAQRDVTWGCTGARTRGRARPVTCPVGSRVRLEVRVPSCWNGRHLDRPDHASHLARLMRVRGSSRLACPRSHPVALPRVVMTVVWATRGAGDLTLSSGSGLTGHADLFNGWAPARQRVLVDRCLNRARVCRPEAGDGASGPGNY